MNNQQPLLPHWAKIKPNVVALTEINPQFRQDVLAANSAPSRRMLTLRANAEAALRDILGPEYGKPRS